MRVDMHVESKRCPKRVHACVGRGTCPGGEEAVLKTVGRKTTCRFESCVFRVLGNYANGKQHRWKRCGRKHDLWVRVPWFP